MIAGYIDNFKLALITDQYPCRLKYERKRQKNHWPVPVNKSNFSRLFTADIFLTPFFYSLVQFLFTTSSEPMPAIFSKISG
jgi:hypothetical protein